MTRISSVTLEDAFAVAGVLLNASTSSSSSDSSQDGTGTIEVGKMADFIIIDRNPLTAPLGEIHKTKVLKTVIAGEEVYSAKGNFQ